MWLGVVERFAVDPLLNTSFIDRYVQGIFLTERKLVQRHSRTVDILTQSPKTSSAVPFADHQYVKAPADETSNTAVAAKPVTLKPCLHTPVMVWSIC